MNKILVFALFLLIIAYPVFAEENWDMNDNGGTTVIKTPVNELNVVEKPEEEIEINEEVGAVQEGNYVVRVFIHAPNVNYSYDIEGDTLELHIVKEVPTPCHNVGYKVVKKNPKYNVFDLVLRVEPPEGNEVCVQVVTEKELDVDFDLNPEERSVTIYLRERGVYTPPEELRNKTLTCAEVLKKIRQFRRELERAIREGDVEKTKRIRGAIARHKGMLKRCVKEVKTKEEQLEEYLKVIKKRMERRPCVAVGVLKRVLEKIEGQASERAVERVRELIEEFMEKCEEKKEKNVEDIVNMWAVKKDMFVEKIEENAEVNTEETLKRLKEEEKKILEKIKALRERLRKIRIMAHRLAVRLKVRRGLVEMGDVNLPEAEIEVNTPEGNVGVDVNEEGVKIEHNGVVVESESELEIEGNTIKAGGRKIKVLPAKLALLVPGRIVKAKLAVENNKPVYEVDGEREGRLLFIIPVKFQVKAVVDAEEGKVVHQEAPWWAFLVR